jgi:meso-butanediol dehydrogenase / (S,S)-butanediol dehydrogenase / diacetyl reductase
MAGGVAIVTGAGSGIGAETAKLLAAQGFTVSLVGRRQAPLEGVAASIAEAGGSAFAVSADLAQPHAPWEVVESTLAQVGRLDVIVNNAGALRTELVSDWTVQAFDDLIAVNLRAPYFLVQAALPPLRESPAACVVNVSSAAAVMFRPRQTVYGLSKAAVEHMTMNLAAELASDGIRVNCVRPGPVATEIYAGDEAEGRLAALARMVPLGRVGEPDEIARWIWHLIDPRAAWVTGTVISVDGGRVLGAREAI